ncbi:MAG: hypothetical protein DWI48_03060 [Chloroflexi bacterium]|nr:MAG: hypothetical protein DWI48_03060 [Chloroflexota bacterium]
MPDKEDRMVSKLVDRITKQACNRCGGHLRPDEVEQYHLTLVCWSCGHRQYISTVTELWF